MPEVVSSAPKPHSEEYLTEKQLAELMGRSTRSVYRWHELRIGPPRITIQKTVLYRKSAVEAWLLAHEISPRPKSRRGR